MGASPLNEDCALLIVGKELNLMALLNGHDVAPKAETSVGWRCCCQGNIRLTFGGHDKNKNRPSDSVALTAIIIAQTQLFIKPVFRVLGMRLRNHLLSLDCSPHIGTSCYSLAQDSLAVATSVVEVAGCCPPYPRFYGSKWGESILTPIYRGGRRSPTGLCSSAILSHN